MPISSMASLLEDFKADCETRGMSHGSTLSYLSAIRLFMIFLDKRNKSAMDVDKDDLRDYVNHLKEERKVAYKTMSYNFSALSAFYGWRVYEGRMEENPVTLVRDRYLKRYKGGAGLQQEGRKLISVEEMARLVKSIIGARNRAVVLILAKTGMRRNELITLDVEDVDFEKMSIRLKPTAKRTNRLLFFDDETKRLLLDWMNMRRLYARNDCHALFTTDSGGRLNKNHVYEIVVSSAQRIGLHIPTSEKLEDHFTPHCCRHWFTTHLRRTGMPREHIQELRGDARPEAIDIYIHIDPEDLRTSYLAHMPRLGI